MSKFIKENHEKRERAEKKIKDEQAIQKQRAKDIEEIKEKMNSLQDVKTIMENKIKEFRIYEVKFKILL